MKKLGFGCMRLPLKDKNDPSSIDIKKTTEMFDLFLSEGFTYFDTAYFYHKSKSEEAIRDILVKRYPRESFSITDKLPIDFLHDSSDVERIYSEQIKRLGTEYFDYYFMHAISRERFDIAAARALASACRSNDPLETVRKIHDALCDRIVYTSDEDMDEDDTAVGALLNGQANCDGYSDAFFLVGRLAGLEVRYQHGDSREKGTDEKNRDVSHLWNLVRIGGAWYLVDVTWDDQDYGTIYTWFCIGADKARQSHIWNEEMSVPLAEKTAP